MLAGESQFRASGPYAGGVHPAGSGAREPFDFPKQPCGGKCMTERNLESYRPRTCPATNGKISESSPGAPIRNRKRSNRVRMTKNYLEPAIEIAQEAGKILIEELSHPLDMRYKGDEVDIVTQAD